MSENKIQFPHRANPTVYDCLERVLAMLDFLGSAEENYDHKNLYRFARAIELEIKDAMILIMKDAGVEP